MRDIGSGLIGAGLALLAWSLFAAIEQRDLKPQNPPIVINLPPGSYNLPCPVAPPAIALEPPRDDAVLAEMFLWR